MDFKFTIIYDNSKDNKTLQEGFGFSCLIEWENKKILFDTGNDQIAFFSNIKKLNINLKNITHVIFSHKHNDHTAGLGEVLNNISSNVLVYFPDDFPDSLLKQVPTNVFPKIMDSFIEIYENTYSLIMAGKYHGSIIHEQSVIFDTPKGLIVLTGCAHPGILNILKIVKEKFPAKKIHITMGGFHLYKSWRFISSGVVRQFKKVGVEKVIPCHCTGEIASEQFRKNFKENYIKAGTGTIIKVKFE
ncbi:MBL fold metallo-hydrolase [Candidatus Nomurabacteria bacterium]|nr:MBL fold metallo-hydrolase [Candidatus Nomurabacteria bacterium]